MDLVLISNGIMEKDTGTLKSFMCAVQSTVPIVVVFFFFKIITDLALHVISRGLGTRYVP